MPTENKITRLIGKKATITFGNKVLNDWEDIKVDIAIRSMELTVKYSELSWIFFMKAPRGEHPYKVTIAIDKNQMVYTILILGVNHIHSKIKIDGLITDWKLEPVPDSDTPK